VRSYADGDQHMAVTHMAVICLERCLAGAMRLARRSALGWSVVACAAVSAQPIVFLGDRDLAPFEFVVSGVPRGANVDLAQAVGRVLGRPVDLQLLDWAESQQRVLGGSGDVLTFFTRTPEREQSHDFTQPTFPLAFALFVRDSERSVYEGRSVSEMVNGRRIGVTSAGFPRAFFESNHPLAQIVLVDNLFDGMRRLINGEIDAFGAPQWSGKFLLSEMGITRVVALPPFVERSGAMAVRKGNAALLGDLNRALTQLKASGELGRIQDRWSKTRVEVLSERTLWVMVTAAAVAATALVLMAWGLAWSRKQKRRLERVIDERRTAERALLETQQALKAADVRKDSFIAMLGHELRNPLAPISTAVHMLGRKSADSKEGQWAREVIRRQVKLMARLIDDLLDVARVTSGKLSLQRQPTLLADVIGDALEVSRPVIDAAGHQLEMSLPEGDVWIDADRARLTQVVMNLLNNAAKYTPKSSNDAAAPGGGRLHLAAAVDGTDLRISMRDNGVGIAAEQLSHLFEMFYQEERSKQQAAGGLGVGLWLTKQVVELHGGTIDVQSAGLNQGSQFTVHLPHVLIAAPAAAVAPASATPHQALNTLRALVADDNEDSAESASRLLVSLGCSVETAFDGEQALQMLQRIQPEFVLLDIAMPKLDGLEVCRRLRRFEWGRSAIAVAMSGWGGEADKQASRDAGFDEHLTKPLDPDRVAELVAQRARQSRA
jgi:signal transduction histidine kinase/ActR/RegA family two-component response regulator